MPYIRYKTWKPSPPILKIVEQAKGILEDFYARGYNPTLRQLHYKFVTLNLYKNTQKNYNRLGKIISQAREGGLIDWNHIKDRVRHFQPIQTWPNCSSFLKDHVTSFHLDTWAGQATRIEVWVEKDALIEVVAKACQPYRVPFIACKGYMSSSAMWQAGHERFLRGDHKHITILHLGDHDPSGLDMTKDIRERLEMFSTPHSGWTRPEIVVQRIGLNMDQVKQYSLPPNFAKETDSRWKEYAAEFGEHSWELDALDPDIIRQLIVSHIEDRMMLGLYESKLTEEEAIRDRLQNIAERIEKNGG